MADSSKSFVRRSRKEMLDKLRFLRIQIAKDRRDTFRRTNLMKQHEILQWAMGATPEEIAGQKFLGGVLNVDL